MRRLVLACVVAAAASQAAGCIITSGDDGDDDFDEIAFITADWDFITADGAGLQCPPDHQTVEVIATGRNGTGENITDLYDCIDLTSGRADYLVGEYDMTIVVTNDARTDDYASSLTFVLDVFNQDASIREDFVDDGGRLRIGADLVTTGTDTPETCASGGVDTIFMTITGGAVLRDELFDCDAAAEDGIDFTDPLIAGDYQVDIVAQDSAGADLGPTSSDQVTMGAPNDYPEDLIGIELQIDP
jgi:hypothetical protein